MSKPRFAPVFFLLHVLNISYALTLLPSCKKEDPDDDPRTIYLDPALNDFKYLPGSYWVYENDSTAALDSIVVVASSGAITVHTPAMHGNPGTMAEEYTVQYRNQSDGSAYHDYMTGSRIIRNGTQHGFGGQPIYWLRAAVGDEFNGTQFIENLDSLRIGSNFFLSLQRVKITAALQWRAVFLHDTYFYFSKQLGVVKKQTDLGNGQWESWSLVRWNIQR